MPINKLLLVHNRYQQPGGEDQVWQAEEKLLRAHDIEVLRYTAHNERIERMSSLAVAQATLWNRDTRRDVLALLRAERPEVVHVHNTFPLISPSVYYAAAATGTPVVQTLHNYRLICPMAEFFRDGGVCEDCLGRTPWPGIVHACYRGSRSASAGVAAMIVMHRMLGTWRRKIHAYIALSEFERQKYVQAGFPEQRIFVKPNFVEPDPGQGSGSGGFALYVGRLTESKGVLTLLEAWSGPMPLPLRIIGDGPLGATVRAATDAATGIRWDGPRPHNEVLAAMREASLLVVPSIWHEPFGMVVAEAFACGLPVVATDAGCFPALIEPRRTGLLFRAGNATELRHAIHALMADPAGLLSMRAAARREYLKRYTGQANYRLLANLYDQVRLGR